MGEGHLMAKAKKHVWVCRQPAGDYIISPTKPKKEESVFDEAWWWTTAEGIEACAKFFESCTGIKMKCGDKPVKMVITITPWARGR